MTYQPVASSWSKLGMIKEASFGAGGAPTDWLPVLRPTGRQPFEPVIDQGTRGTGVQDYAVYQGPGRGEHEMETLLWADTSGLLFMLIFGVDTVTGAGPFTHTFSCVQSAMPQSASISDFDGVSVRQYLGMYLAALELRWAEGSPIAVKTRFLGQQGQAGAGISPAYGAIPPVVSWRGTTSIGGVANPRIREMQLVITRPIQLGWGSSQLPTMARVGPISASGQLRLAVPDNTEYNYYLNNTQPSLSCVFNSSTSPYQAQLLMNQVAFMPPAQIDRSGDMAEFTCGFRAINNATDGGCMRVALTNQRSGSW